MGKPTYAQPGLLVRYPTGASFRAVGTLHFIDDAGGPLSGPWIFPDDPNGAVLGLDPRGIVEHDGVVVYNPRAHLDRLPAWTVAWLVEHPTWARGAAA